MISAVRSLVATVAALLVVSCTESPRSHSEPPTEGVSDVATGLSVPWGIAFLPDGSALIAERNTGAIVHRRQDGAINEVGRVAGVAAGGEGGLLGLATAESTVFAYVTTGADNRVVRMDFDGAALGTQTPILTGIPAGSIHDGGRIAFGPDGKLYVATGERGVPELAQDLSSLGGKILRVDPDGSIPADNPFPGSAVWSYGHRNVQGLAWDPAGRLWATEYGARSWDELNLIEAGGNYGWPTVEGRAGRDGFIDPALQWTTDEASPSGLAYHAGSLWVAALRGQRLIRVPVAADGSLGPSTPLFVNQFGRLRTVLGAPDGALWFTTSNRDGRGDARDGDDRILQFRP